jgi:hypothetical protein
MDEKERDEEGQEIESVEMVDITPQFKNYNWVFESSHVKTYIFRHYKQGMLYSVMMPPDSWTWFQFRKYVEDMFDEWVWSQEDYVVRFLGLFPAVYDEDGVRIYQHDRDIERYESMSESEKFDRLLNRLAMNFFDRMDSSADY